MPDVIPFPAQAPAVVTPEMRASFDRKLAGLHQLHRLLSRVERLRRDLDRAIREIDRLWPAWEQPAETSERAG